MKVTASLKANFPHHNLEVSVCEYYEGPDSPLGFTIRVEGQDGKTLQTVLERQDVVELARSLFFIWGER